MNRKGFQDPFRIAYDPSSDFEDRGVELSDQLSDGGSIVFAERTTSYDESVSPYMEPLSSPDQNQIIRMSEKSADNLLFLSLLGQMCTMVVGDEERSKSLFLLLYEKLGSRNLIQHVGPLDRIRPIMQTYQKELQNVMVAALNSLDIIGMNPEKVLNKLQVNIGTPLHSWYKDMFCDESKIASGGFGAVVKVKNKLDQKYYAVKKVRLVESRPGVCYKTLREVKTFSDLHHSNIVRYHCSWLEYGVSEMDNSDGNDLSSVDSSSSSHSSSYSEDDQFGTSGLVRNGQAHNLLTYHKQSNDSDSVFDGKKRKSSFTKSLSTGDQPLSHEQIEEISFVRGKFYDSTSGRREAHKMTLFIQMELCQLTLRKWMDERKEIDSEINILIFRQLINGFEFIHEKGLIHRDIKPANIFLNFSTSGVALKIGDFGLARDDGCPQTPTGSESEKDSFSIQRTFVGYTQGVGTTVYAAPEQKISTNYTNKVDVYSAGIILFELFRAFKTVMERMKSLNNLLEVPTCGEEEHNCSDVCSLMLLMTSKDPSKRPSTRSLLEHSVLTTKDAAVGDKRLMELERKCTAQELEIVRLNNLISSMKLKFCESCHLTCKHKCGNHQNS